MKDNNDLAAFDWDKDEVFFGTPSPEAEPIVDKPIENEDPVEEDTDPDKPVIKDEDESIDKDSFFGTTPDKEEGDLEDAPAGNEDTKGYWNDVYSDFKDSGLFNHVDLEEGEVLTSERLLELQETEYETEVSTRIKSWADEMDDDAKAFIKFKANGGNTSEFFDTYQNSTGVPQGEITEESHQDKVIRYQLKKEGWDADEIEDRLEYLTTSKKKEAVAKRYNKKLATSSEQEKAALTAKLEQGKIAAKKEEDNFKNTIKSTLGDSKEIRGFKITPKDQENLYSLLTRKQFKTQGGKSITGFQKKIGEAFQDPEKMILIAKLVDSDFDMTSFEKKATTKSTRTIKRRIEGRRGSGLSGSASVAGEGSLADLF